MRRSRNDTLRSPTRLWRKALATSLMVSLASLSCASMGAGKLTSSHTAYNDAVQLTVAREVLANIVRSRYSDPMQFIAVSAINAQFSISAGASAGAGGIGQGASGQAGGSVGYSDSPTITFVPQSDAGFYKSLYSPFDVGEAIGFALSYRFARSNPDWQELSLKFSFAAVNGASDYVGGLYNQLYQQRIDAWVQLMRLGAEFQLVPEWDFDTATISKEKVTAEDMVAAFRMNLNFIEEDDGESVRLARYRLVLALTLPDPHDPEGTRALENLGVLPGRAQYVLRPPDHSAPGETDPYAIRVTPRSMADIISIAGQFVEVPAAHADLVPPVELTPGESVVMSSVRIRSSGERPPSPYRIEHRGYWFYVDDYDIDSKVFFEAVVAAYSSRVGSKQAGDTQPQVVLPVGGG